MRNETKSRIRVSMAVLALCGLGIAASPTVRAATTYGQAGYTAGNGITITQTGDTAEQKTDEFSINIDNNSSSYLSFDNTSKGLKLTIDGAIVASGTTGATGLVTGSTVYEYIKSITGTSSASVGEGQNNLVTGHAVHSYVRNLTGSQATDISDDGTKLVTGKAVYKYTTPVAKNEYSLKTVSTANSVGTNLGLLDAAIQDTNTDMAKLIRLADVSEKGTIKIGTGVTATTVSIADSTSKARRLAGVDTAVNNTDAVNFKQMTDTINSYGVAQTQTIYATATDDGNVIKSKDGKSKLATFSLADASNLDANNTGFVSGGALYAETREAIVTSEETKNYINVNNTAAQNILALDQALGTKPTGGKYIGETATVNANLKALDTAIGDNTEIKNQNGYLTNSTSVNSNLKALDAKAVAKQQTIYAVTGSDTTDNEIEAVDGTVLATFSLSTAATLSASDTGFVSGGVLYNEVRPTEAGNYISNQTTAANLKALDDAIGAKLTGDSYRAIQTNKTVTENLALLDSALKGVEQDRTDLISYNSDTGTIQIGGGESITGTTVSFAKGQTNRTLTGVAAGGNKNEVAVWDQIAAAGQTIAATNANISESNSKKQNIIYDNAGNAIATFKLADSTLSATDTGFVSGGALYAETRAAIADTNAVKYYVSAENTAAANILALDNAIGAKLTGESYTAISKDKTVNGNLEALDTEIGNVKTNTEKLITSDDTAIKIGTGYIGKSVSIADSDNNARKLSGVAAGQDDTDAVNVGQLYSAYVGSDTITITKETDPAQNVIRVKNMAMSTMWDSAKAPTATGNYSFAIGGSADASGDYAYALGSGSKATGTGSVALGGGAEATWTALSPDSSGTTGGTIAIGPNAKASGNGGAAIGAEAVATGEDSVAFGSLAKAAGYEGTAIGSEASAGSMSATAIGAVSNASGIASSAFGYYSKASGDASTTLGYGSGAMGTGTTSVGAGAKAYNGADYSVAIGANSESQAQKSVAIGFESVASEANTVSFGHKSTDMHKTAQGSVAYGSDSLSWLTNVADGRKTHEAATWDQLVQSGQSVTLDGNTTSYTFKNNAQGEVFTVGITKGAVSQGNTGYVTGGDVWNAIAKYAQTIDFSNVGQTTQGGQQGAAQGGASTTTESNKIYTNDGQVIATIRQGSVSNGDTGFVSGGQVYAEDVKKDQTITLADNGNIIKNNAENKNLVTFQKAQYQDGDNGFVSGDQLYDNTLKENQKLSFATGENTIKTHDNQDRVTLVAAQYKKDDTGIVSGGQLWDQSIAAKQNVSFESGKNVIKNNKGDTLVTFTQGTVSEGNKNMVSGGDVWSADVASGQKIYLTNGQNALKNNNGDVLATFYSSEVAQGDSGFVSGGDLFEEVRPADGVYVRESMTTAENLNTLDYALAETNDRINRVGAGAAALAALHPEDFNPEDKWSFAAGYGHYKNANAGAFGVFYKPNADTTVSLASTIGNGNTMVNAGVSFKLGQRGVAPVKPDAKTIQKLATENASQAKKIETLEADNAQMKADNEKMKAQIAEILKKLELSETVQKSAAH